jgi:hypothetical protein
MSMDPTHSAAIGNLRQPEEGQEDPFIIAYDEFLVVRDRVAALAKECEAITAAMPDSDKRNPRALLGVQTEGEQTTAIFAESHEEIDQAMDRMELAPGLGETTDLTVIKSFRDAAHAAFDLDAILLESARERSGLDAALTQHMEALEEKWEALDHMLTLTPITPQGCAWLARFVHAEANDLGPSDIMAKAAHNLARGLSSMVFGDRFWPKPH